MFEDNSVNRMQESLELFKEVAGNPIFEKTPIFVFLNKKDLFEEMIATKVHTNIHTQAEVEPLHLRMVAGFGTWRESVLVLAAS